MEHIKKRVTHARYGKGLIIIIYLVGLIGLSLPGFQQTFIDLISLNLFFSCLMLILFHEHFSLQQMGWFVVVLVFGFAIELVGVQSGLVFGEYQYGASLGIKIANTPLLIGVNWLMLIYMVYHLLQELNLSSFKKSLAGASILLIYDILLEPLARPLDFWYWEGGGIPLQNYVAWGVISFVFLLAWNSFGVHFKNRVATTLLITQMTFFLLLNITYGNV